MCLHQEAGAMTAAMETGVLDTEGALKSCEPTAWLESPEGEAWSKG